MTELWARLLLKRYGIVFRALLERESAPPWGELLPVLRRLESRGEVRGGRFVTRMAGEQFALPEAVPLLRKQRNPEGGASVVWLSAADPLNLVGTILAGRRIPAVGSNALLLRSGVPLARLEAGTVDFDVEAPAVERHRWASLLLAGPQPRARAAEPAA